MVANISFPRFLKVGPGAIETLGEVLSDLSIQRPLLVTDTYMVANGSAERLLTLIEASGRHGALYSKTVPDPTSESLQAGVSAVASHRADAIIGLGGGSPMDTAKALAVLSVRGGDMRDFKAPRRYSGPALPVIAIPTTAGSGSEATQFTIITDGDNDEKMLCPGLSFLPIASIVDSQLTTSMPPRLTADTGVDALTHAIEAYVSKRANPISDGLALSAMRTIGRFLLRAYRDGTDTAAREALMHASTQAGMAFSNASVCLVHGMSRPVGAHFHVTHGLSNAMLLPAVTEFSIAGATDRYAECARQLEVAGIGDPDNTAAQKLVDYLNTLCADVEVPKPREYGLDRTEWERLTPLMAEQALASGSPSNNPIVPTVDEIVHLYRNVFGS